MNISRSKCLITGSQDLEELHNYSSFPVFIGCTDQDRSKDKFADLKLSISKSSGIIQLSELLPLELIYSEYHSEALGSVWKEHHLEFSLFVKNNINELSVLEIGGSNCEFAELCINLNKKLCWSIVEPNLFKNSQKDISLYNGFIEERLDLVSSSRNVVHSHVLEHLYNPMDVLKKISCNQLSGSRMIFSIPNLFNYLKHKFVNTINFEHTYFLTEEVVIYMFESLSYKLVEKRYFENHSIFYCFEKIDGTHKDISITNNYKINKKAYLEMITHYTVEVDLLNNAIHNYNGEVFIFGAHIFTQYLTYMGLDTKRIKCILDNSKIKLGKRLYGNSLFVSNPDIIQDLKNPLVIVRAGQYQSEIINQLKKINSSVVII